MATWLNRNRLLTARLLLPGLLLVGLALRVYRLPAQSLWYDEGVTWYLTRMPLPQLTVWTANDIQPPLYYYLLWPWVRAAGSSEYSLRFPSVVFGVLMLPLLWVVARRLFGRPVAWLALLLGVVSPLNVYYAQEARMYTLLTLLGLLSSYLLWRLLDVHCGAGARVSGSRSTGLLKGQPDETGDRASSSARSKRDPRLRLAVAYVLATAAMLYAHYFAVFLLAAHAVYAVYRLLLHRWPAPSPRRDAPTSSTRLHSTERGAWGEVGRILLVPVAILILYAPWLPLLLGRYGLDSSYWPGALKLDEVARKLFITFAVGETVKEGVGVWLALGYGIILVICLGALVAKSCLKCQMTYGKDGARGGAPVVCHLMFDVGASPLVFVGLYFVVPLALVLLLAYHMPKFNPRYAMPAWPAFVLLLAGGLSWLMGGLADARCHRVTHLCRGISALALVFILGTSAYSLANWYAPYPDNQFNKADFRITAEVVRQRIGPDETVLLSSGHMFPAWAYYYGWQGWHPLPPIEVLDVNAALDMSVGRQLDDLLRGKRGAWLVRWQSATTDPFEVLPLLLGAGGVQDDDARFWHMELRHYRLPPAARFDLDSFVTRPLGMTFGGQLRLLGLSILPPSAPPDSASLPATSDPSRASAEGPSDANLVLVWQAIGPVEDDYTVFVHLLDDAGSKVATADHLPARPTHEWPAGRILPDRTRLALSSDLPDGGYRLEVGLYDAEQPDLPRLGPVIREDSGELQPGERVLIPVTIVGGRLE